ncbi:MAG: phosphocholine cytidylyltransferase family protein [Hyphomicrobiales bacterium]|nr:phosphocholine cytidylyltransferase family protein [Hyphomicrobiales bacterium]
MRPRVDIVCRTREDDPVSSHSGQAAPRALILAAGAGVRLHDGRPNGEELPKALLRFGGRSLLERHLASLRAAQVTDISIVVGYREDAIRKELDGNGGASARLIINPDFEKGSIVSLLTGREILESGTPVILMDADVLYDVRLLARLLRADKPNCLLLDRDIEPGDEPVKLCVANGHIVDFHKRPKIPHEWHGESVGFFRFTQDAAAELAKRAQAYVESGLTSLEYEEPIRDMILASPPDRFGFEDISGLPWTEIDFPQDVIKARALLPLLGE